MTWTTKSGINATLELRDSKTVSVDGIEVERRDWRLVARAGDAYLLNPTIETHPQAKVACLRAGRTWLAIPDELLEPVTALVHTYQTEADRQFARSCRAAREYQESHDMIERIR
jgi:hypothetical protein